MNKADIANFRSGSTEPLLLIAGPCQLESEEHALKIAIFLKELANKLPVNLVFKASFDKANRTSLKGTRGPGLQEGLKILERIKEKLHVPLLTDIHTAEQAAPAAAIVDVLQIPAFLCRQTDLLIAAGNTGRCVNIKKGQFLAPEDMQFAAEKVASTGNRNILLCERGTSFGYRDLIVDMRAIPKMRALGYPVVFDATHSVQSPGGLNGSSGGSREFIPFLSRAAAAVGIDGLFIECHDDPDRAPSDGANMLQLDQLAPLLHSVCEIRKLV